MSMNFCRWFAVLGIVLCLAYCGESTAESLLSDANVRPGLVVHLDCGDGRYGGTGFSRTPGSSSRESVEKARQLIAGKGLYGRVSRKKTSPPQPSSKAKSKRWIRRENIKTKLVPSSRGLKGVHSGNGVPNPMSH